MPDKPDIADLIEPHVLRARPPRPSRLVNTSDGAANVPLAPGGRIEPATIYPLHKRPKSPFENVRDD